MGYEIAGKNLMLNALAAAAGYIGILNSSGVELSGGSPAYVRKAATWNAAADGAITLSNGPIFDIPAGTTIKYAGFYLASSGGTLYGMAQLSNQESYTGQGLYTLDAATLDLNLEPA
ncbi:MAG: hypothetical protein HPY50_04895 [Firmicutes bacterium]|nr:hypothetical protein [Bacillota bacterium]